MAPALISAVLTAAATVARLPPAEMTWGDVILSIAVGGNRKSRALGDLTDG